MKTTGSSARFAAVFLAIGLLLLVGLQTVRNISHSKQSLNDLMCRKNLTFLRLPLSLYAGDSGLTDSQAYWQAASLMSDTNFLQRYQMRWRFSRDGIHAACPLSPWSEVESYEGRRPTERVSLSYFASVWEKKPYHDGKRHVLMSDGRAILIPEAKFAILTNEVEFLNRLVVRDPDFDATEAHLLIAAAEAGRDDILAQLTNFPSQQSLNQALIAAAERGQTNTLKLLIGKGAQIEAKKQGWSVDGLPETALMRAAANGHFEAVRILIEHGADVHASEGRALCYATIHRHTNIVELLRVKGATTFRSIFHPVDAARKH